MTHAPNVFSQAYFHGTKADLKAGDMISVGYRSNFTEEVPLSWVYLTSTMDAAIWGAELSLGEGPERIYVVEPTGNLVDDPNVTDKRFPGNPTMSFRSRESLRVIAEVVNWHGHSPEQVQRMKDGLAKLTADGTNHIID